MATEAFQIYHRLTKLAAASLLEPVLQYTSNKPEHHPSVDSVPSNTLQGLIPELIGEIASHLNSADLHSLRNTAKWLTVGVDHHYHKRHPTHTICRGVQELPRILNQLATPAVYRNIAHLTLTGSMSDTPYPAIRHMFKLPRLETLVLKDIEMDAISLVQTISYHLGTLRSFVSITCILVDQSVIGRPYFSESCRRIEWKRSKAKTSAIPLSIVNLSKYICRF